MAMPQRRRRRGSSQLIDWSVELTGTQGKAVGCRGAEGWVTGSRAAGRCNKVKH